MELRRPAVPGGGPRSLRVCPQRKELASATGARGRCAPEPRGDAL